VLGRIANHASSSIPVLEPAMSPARAITADGPGAGDAFMTSQAVSQLPRSSIIGDLKLTALKSRL
jgi:cleavage and polyadenylation specificity factor subunit 2